MKANRYCVLTACQTVSPDVAWSRNLCWVLTVYRVEGVNRVGTALRLQPVVTPWGYVILEPPPTPVHRRDHWTRMRGSRWQKWDVNTAAEHGRALPL